MIVVSAVSLLLIVTLITVIIIQCLLVLRMRKSNNADPTMHKVSVSPNQEYKNSSIHMDVPVTPNAAYSLHSEDMTYEMVN